MIQHVIATTTLVFAMGSIASTTLQTLSNNTDHNTSSLETADAHSLHCAVTQATDRKRRAETLYWHYSALAQSGRGTDRAVHEARANLAAARTMLRRAEFAVSEGEVAFGLINPQPALQC